jgi:mono/diheme cytochrome c family protein
MSVLAWGLCAVATLPLRLAHAGEGEGEQPYTVQCKAGAASAADCQVDKKTYIGWRTYHANCHVCHAQDAVGSSFAPSLIQRIQEISKEQYMNSVVNGYTGQIGVMPGWKDNPNVNKRFEELYIYLSARANGALPPGRPKQLK